MGTEYCDQHVRLCVCVSVREHNSGTTGPNFTKSSLLVTYDRVSVILWRRCDALCTSGFVDDVMFAHNGRERRRKTAYAQSEST